MRDCEPTITVAILGADSVVGDALCVLLEGSGYDTTTHRAEVPEPWPRPVFGDLDALLDFHRSRRRD